LITQSNAEVGFGRREGIASVGFKLQTIYSVVRGMVDTMGKVSGVAEYVLAPGLTFNVFLYLFFFRLFE
jgi:mitochondrial import receptor subunit TOM40